MSFVFVDFCALFAFSYAFCGANWVARFEISDHGNVRARVEILSERVSDLHLIEKLEYI